MKKKSPFFWLTLTTGDLQGIGLEVTSKALFSLGPKKNFLFFIFRSARLKKNNPYLKLIDKKFKRITLNLSKKNTLKSILDKTLNAKKNDFNFSYKNLIDLSSSEPAPRWVHEATQECLKKNFHALITGPLSKESFFKAGYPLRGHTEALKKWSQKKKLFMSFIGKKCSVLLATGHIPLSKLTSHFNAEVLKEALLKAYELKTWLFSTPSLKFKNLPIGVLGLNPHAGEKGLIGTEESLFYKKTLNKVEKILKKKESKKSNKTLLNKNFIGPLVPDVAFLPKNLKKYSILVSPYHDQGLIGFKTLHGNESGVHLTMGLPFLRASVSHGVALDIFKKNKANPASMLQALKITLTLLKARKE